MSTRLLVACALTMFGAATATPAVAQDATTLRGPDNANQLSNSDGPEVWYTNAFGRNGQTEPFPGSIRQRLAKMDSNVGVDAGGSVIGNNRNYAGPGVHAPN
jgi:hypothetical protein